MLLKAGADIQTKYGVSKRIFIDKYVIVCSYVCGFCLFDYLSDSFSLRLIARLYVCLLLCYLMRIIIEEIVRIWWSQLHYCIILRRYDDVMVISNFIRYNYYCNDDDYLCSYFISGFFEQRQCC